MSKTEHIKGGDKEDDNDKPFDERADKAPRIEIESGAAEHVIDFRAAEQIVHFERLYDLVDNLAKERTNRPTNDKDNNCHDEIRYERNNAFSEATKRISEA